MPSAAGWGPCISGMTLCTHGRVRAYLVKSLVARGSVVEITKAKGKLLPGRKGKWDLGYQTGSVNTFTYTLPLLLCLLVEFVTETKAVYYGFVLKISFFYMSCLFFR